MLAKGVRSESASHLDGIGTARIFAAGRRLCSCASQLPSASTISLQQGADLRCKRRVGKGLDDQLDAGIEPAVVYKGIACVAGGEQHLQLRSTAPRLVGQLAPIHPAR